MKALADLASYRALVERTLRRVLPPARTSPPRLHEAMRYATLAPAKRLRACMTILAGELFGVDPGRVAGPAASLELIHAYSLVHDDLPCMDDDALRRGRPTCHVKFGVANAVLTGDALLALAFEVLAGEAIRSRFPPAAVIAGLTEVSAAAGSRGLVAGQFEDLAGEGRSVGLARLRRIHAQKTGRLFTASLRLGALLAGAPALPLEALTRYGGLFGQVFQITDDILNVTGSEAVLGKAVGSDAQREKATYPRLMGLDRCREFARKKAVQAAGVLDVIGTSDARRRGERGGRGGRSAASPTRTASPSRAIALLRALVLSLPERTH